MARQQHLRECRRLVVKVGTRLVAGSDAGVNADFLDRLGREAARLLARGKSLLIVTSGAVHLGRKVLTESRSKEALSYRQAAAAIGQPELMRRYSEAFAAHGVLVAQVLLTPADVADRERYLHIRSAFGSLLDHNIVPVVNENDSVSEASVTFGENDKLAAMIAAKVRADVLVFLLDQEGFYAADPREDPAAELIPTVQPSDESVALSAGGEGGPESMGGMAKKLAATRTAVECGIPVIMADGREPNILLRLLEGEELGTFFVPAPRISGRKSWLASATTPDGAVHIDAGAKAALLAPKGRSLLPSGVTGVEGQFEAGDVLAVCDEAGREIARGISNFSSDEIQRIAGAHTNEVSRILGYETQPEVIHRDNLAVTAPSGKAEAPDAD
jgi:glutamate 5-kinase